MRRASIACIKGFVITRGASQRRLSKQLAAFPALNQVSATVTDSYTAALLNVPGCLQRLRVLKLEALGQPWAMQTLAKATGLSSLDLLVRNGQWPDSNTGPFQGSFDACSRLVSLTVCHAFPLRQGGDPRLPRFLSLEKATALCMLDLDLLQDAWLEVLPTLRLLPNLRSLATICSGRANPTSGKLAAALVALTGLTRLMIKGAIPANLSRLVGLRSLGLISIWDGIGGLGDAEHEDVLPLLGGLRELLLQKRWRAHLPYILIESSSLTRLTRLQVTCSVAETAPLGENFHLWPGNPLLQGLRHFDLELTNVPKAAVLSKTLAPMVHLKHLRLQCQPGLSLSCAAALSMLTGLSSLEFCAGVQGRSGGRNPLSCLMPLKHLQSLSLSGIVVLANARKVLATLGELTQVERLSLASFDWANLVKGCDLESRTVKSGSSVRLKLSQHGLMSALRQMAKEG